MAEVSVASFVGTVDVAVGSAVFSVKLGDGEEKGRTVPVVSSGVLVGFGSFSGFLQELNKKMENSTVKMLIRQIIAIFLLRKYQRSISNFYILDSNI